MPALVGSPAYAANTLTATVTAAEGSNAVLTLHSDAAATFTLTVAPTPNSGATPPVGGAVEGSDYTTLTSAQKSQVFTAAGDKTITIPITADGLYEGPEAFTVTATPSGGGTALNSVVTITDGDSVPSYTLSAAPNPVTESANAKTTITAKLSGPSSVDTTINLSTANGTAVAGTAPAGDYTALSAVALTIPAGTLTGTKDVQITNDGVKDQQEIETFTVNGSATSGVAPTAQSTSVKIVDAQSTPKLTLSGGGNGTEGGSGTTFRVTTDIASELPITVQWNAVATTPAAGHAVATPGDDFDYPSTRTVTIPAGDLYKEFTIPLLADTLNEDPEDYTIQLVNPTNAVLGATTKVAGSITDATPAPTVAVTPVTVTEGNSGKMSQVFTATLSAKSAKTVKVNWATADLALGYGNARAAKDYVPAAGQLTFTPGTQSATFSVDILGDTIDEGPSTRTAGGTTSGEGEKFTIDLSAVPGSDTFTVGSPAEITILDDDAAPTLAFDDLSVKEGNSPWVAILPVKLTGSSDRPITVAPATLTPSGTNAAQLYSTTFGTDDYAPLSQSSITIPAEASTAWVPVLVNGDSIYEPDETVALTVTPGSTTTGSAWLLGTPTAADPATLTLQNDDTAPDLEVKSVKGMEGETVRVWGTVTGTSQTAINATVSFIGASVHGSKAAGTTDFTNPGASPVTIDPGTASGSTLWIADVPLLKDDQVESEETILATGSTTGNKGTVTDGVIYIAGDSSTPEEPGGEEPGEAPKPTINAPMSVNGTGPVSITGKVAANATVELWGAPYSGGELKWIANTKANAMGMYSFSRSITMGMRFKTQSQEVNSDEKTVWVNQWASLTATSPSKGRVSVVVKTSPNAADRKVVVQRWTGPNTWTNILVSKANVNGAYAATTVVPSGTIALRAWVEGDADMGINGPGWTDIVRPVIK
ncbi:hypothetical protein OWR29_18240 [Actinoplanes sp. Pm04-4]|uniref:Calx-beta domain-containing protein n=1 Tax=Paractinoplanes pyxinae TaxID=2997416 RepID=A0ABT4B1K6_9ACTN|nr:Calx-beta domain-containing protein [Actinoplanes pyxinae]MCY1139947.1 hypothetical protein [Actinoplanes pyxinae]